MLVHLVARRTEVVGQLIFYPLIVWTILFFARHKYFDNWNTTLGLAIVMTIGVLITWTCALMLRFAAEKLRKTSILRLRDQQVLVIADNKSDDLKKLIEYAIDDIKSIQTGAFAPFSQHPVFHSILVAISSIGGTYLIDFISIFNF
jgi:hypothetical protein